MEYLKLNKLLCIVFVLAFSMCLNSYSNNMLNDITYEEIYKKNEEDRLTYTFEKLIYKNSNWDNINLSRHFLSKFNSKDGICPELMIEYVRESYISMHTEMVPGKRLLEVLTKNGEKKYYIYKLIFNDKNEIDDAQMIKIPENDYDKGEDYMYTHY